MHCGKIVCIGQNYRDHIKELKTEVRPGAGHIPETDVLTHRQR